MQANNEITKILNPEMNFIEEVEECISANCDLFDCIQTWCEVRSIEFAQIVPIIKNNSHFKIKVHKEAERLNFLKKKR